MTAGLSQKWLRLQNGSDIRGVALAGVASESVNLTPEIAFLLGQAFVSWLADKWSKATGVWSFRWGSMKQGKRRGWRLKRRAMAR